MALFQPTPQRLGLRRVDSQRGNEPRCFGPLYEGVHAKLHAAASRCCSLYRDCAVRALDRAGTAANKTFRPSAIVGCAKIASRSEVYGSFASMAVCATAMTSPASVPKAVNPRISSLSALTSAFRNPRVSESVCVRRTLAIGILVSRYGMACFWASDSFTATRANSGSVNMQNGISRPETRERDHNRHQSNNEDRPRNS